jgi:hypothetical protein
MTQPAFVPIAEYDQVRPALRLATPHRWTATRPAEVRVPRHATSPMMGNPGPDQGYALRLAHHFEPRLVLVAGEDVEDVELGAALLAARRAGSFGRAPCAHDLRAALGLWGFLTDRPPEGLVEERTRAFKGVAHDYHLQRALVGRVPEETLRLPPDQVEGQVAAGEWRALVGAPPLAGLSAGGG